MIGVIDSGSGGLSVMRALIKELPAADYLYFGDIKHAPYGNKSHAKLSRLTIDALKFLKDNQVNNVVSACNSVSAAMAISLFDTLLSSQNIIEMVGPTVSTFTDDNRRIAICATQATIDSGMYQNGFHMTGRESVVAIPIPELAGQIEFGADTKDITDSIQRATESYRGSFDVLIMGCTHYSLVTDIFQAVAGKEVEVFDPAIAVARRAEQLFSTEKNTGTGRIRFVISQESPQFRTYVQSLFPDATYTVEVAP